MGVSISGLPAATVLNDADVFEIEQDGVSKRLTKLQLKTLNPPDTSPTLVAPNIGIATGTSLAVTGLIKSSGGLNGIGYSTGAGSTVAQATNRTTTVTLNRVCGQITTQATSLAAQTSVSFTLVNSAIAIGDVVVANIQSGSTGNKTIVSVNSVAAGSCLITLFNTDAAVADTGAALINFAVIKAVSS